MRCTISNCTFHIASALKCLIIYIPCIFENTLRSRLNDYHRWQISFFFLVNNYFEFSWLIKIQICYLRNLGSLLKYNFNRFLSNFNEKKKRLLFNFAISKSLLQNTGMLFVTVFSMTEYNNDQKLIKSRNFRFSLFYQKHKFWDSLFYTTKQQNINFTVFLIH